MTSFDKKENNDYKQAENSSGRGDNRMEAESPVAGNPPPPEGDGKEKECKKKEPEHAETEKNAEKAFREENEILKDQLFRLAADFDNFRKRTVRQMEENRKVVLEQVLLDFAEVTDNFERALKSARTAEDVNSIICGIEQLSKQFFSILQKYGLEKIECETAGEFDPHMHEAVQHVETSEVPDNTILEVYKPGLVLNSKVIRPAMVSVAKNPGDGENSPEESPEK